MGAQMPPAPQMQQPQVGFQQGFNQSPMGGQAPQAGFSQPQMGGQAPQAPQMPNMGSFQSSMLAAGMAAAAGGGGFNQAMGNAFLQEGGAALQQTGLSRWFPFLFANLQGQFNVGHGFVLRKLVLLLCPFVQQSQGTPVQSYGNDPSPGGPMRKETGSIEHLKVDINEPDLYIPLMSMGTYCLVYCVQRGLMGDFKIEVLAATISFAMVLFIVEVVAAKMGFFIAGSQVSVLELMGTCGYKYVHVVLMVLIRIGLGSSHFYYVFFAYLAACSGFALRRFMSRFEASHAQQYGVQTNAMHGHIILGLAIAQIPLCWLLTPSSAYPRILNAAMEGATGAS